MQGLHRCRGLLCGSLPFISVAVLSCGEGPRAPRQTTIAEPPVPVGSAGAFADVTAAAGIAFAHRIPDGDLSNIVESVGSGAAFLDYDGDGFLDVYFGNQASVEGVSTSPDAAHEPLPALYRNRRDGTFEERTEEAGLREPQFTTAVAAADYDGDGDTDLYVVNYGPNRLYQNQGDGTFHEVGKRARVDDDRFGVGATFFDYDADGDLDLYLANYLRFDPKYRIYYSADAFPGPLAYEPEPSVLYQNQGDGTFRDVTAATGLTKAGGRAMSVVAFDCDEDGDVDLFVANDMTQNLLFKNDGHGHFTECGLWSGVAFGENGDATSAMAADVADYDGDGHLDLCISDISYGSLFRGDGHGTFLDKGFASGLGRLWAQYVTWGAGFIDYDDDGDADIFAVNGGLHHLVGWPPLLIENDGKGRFGDASGSAGSFFDRKLIGRGWCAADYDNDGDQDVLVTRLNEPPVLLRNDLTARGAWLTLTLVGKRSHREGYGARVTVIAGNLERVLEHRCPNGYLSQGDPRLHIGLGDHDRVDRLVIRWPSGTLEELRDVPARQFLVIEEAEL